MGDDRKAVVHHYWNMFGTVVFGGISLQIQQSGETTSLLTHHCDFVPLDADVRPSEVAQSGDGSDAGSIHQVPVVIQHVDIHSDLPHLRTDTQFTYSSGFSVCVVLTTSFCLVFSYCHLLLTSA